MKRLMNVLLFFSFIVLLSFFVSGQIAPHSADDVLFRISPHIPSGAHVENATMNTAVYTPIYYSDIFSSTYSGSTTGLRVCNSNKVLRFAPNPLQPGTNGHAETPDLSTSGYIDICYGTLTCTYSLTGTCSGSGNPQPVISISGTTSGSGVTNAHVAPATGNGAYTGKICCSAGGSNPSTGLHGEEWRDSQNVRISANTRICPSVVKMKVSVGTTPPTSVNFKVFDKDSGSETTPDDLITTISSVNVVGLEAIATLDITSASNRQAFQQAITGENNEGTELELYFEAENAQNTADNVKSYEIRYTDNSALCSNPWPDPRIQAPTHRGVYFTNTNLNFVGDCRSSGGADLEWTITQDGQTPVTLNTNNAPYSFTASGQANVRLKCTETTSPNRVAYAEAQILVVDPSVTKTLAYINEPAFNGFADNRYSPSTTYFPALVNFKATDSFVVKVTPSQTNACPTVECLGGNCLQNTQNIPSGVAGCTGNNIPITPYSSTNKFDSMEFTWKFWDNNNHNWEINSPNTLSEGFQNYIDISENLNDKHMSVKVKHTTSSAEASFQRNFTLGRCLDEGTKYYTSHYEYESTYEANDACKGLDVTAGTPDDCCHIGYECEQDPVITTKYSCQLQNNPILRCEDYTLYGGMTACEGNTDPRIPRNSYGQEPQGCDILECYWITSGTNANTCDVRSIRRTCGNGQDPRNVNPPTQTCDWVTTSGQCSPNGERIITSTRSASSPASCGGPRTATVRCGTLSFELGFFGRTQFLMSVVLIIAIYLIYLVFNSKGIKRHEKIK